MYTWRAAVEQKALLRKAARVHHLRSPQQVLGPQPPLLHPVDADHLAARHLDDTRTTTLKGVAAREGQVFRPQPPVMHPLDAEHLGTRHLDDTRKTTIKMWQHEKGRYSVHSRRFCTAVDADHLPARHLKTVIMIKR
jgi:hypothetical protein